MSLRSRSLANRRSSNRIFGHPYVSNHQFESLEQRYLLSTVPQLVADINATSSSSDPDNFTELNGILFFVAFNPDKGRELWRSDGTAAGTMLVKDINPGPGNSSPSSLINVGGTLFFVAVDRADNTELWKSDGTESGTVLVKEIRAGSDGSDPRYLTNVGGTLFFRANDGRNGRELWKSQGTSSSTVLVKDIDPILSSSPAQLTNVNGTLFFTATGRDPSGSPYALEVWKSDGTAAGTVLVKDLNPGIQHSSAGYLTNINGTLFFKATDGISGIELWKSDGTEAGTELVKDMRPGSITSFPRDFTPVGETLYLVATGASPGLRLWKSDGTEDGTVIVKDIQLSAGGTWLTAVGDVLFFRANDGINGFELWKSDGTEAGTVLVKDIASGDSLVQHLTNVGGMLFFSADNGVDGIELWKSDGTTDGTVMVANLALDGLDSAPQGFTVVGNALFFSADVPEHGRELFKLDLLIADAGGSYIAREGQPIAISASSNHLNSTIYEWDLDNNGSFETVGQTVSFTADDNGIFHVPLRVTGPTGTAFDTATIEVENLPPIARVGGVMAGFTDLPSNLRLFADDPSSVDQAAGFDFEIDFDGDGTVDDVLHGSSGLLVSHTFAASDVYQVLVTAVDKDGGRSNTASHRVVNIDAVREADAEQPALTNLVWTGTDGDDHVVFTQTSTTTVLIELHQLNGVPLSPSFRAYMFGINGRVIADGLAGNDLIDLDGVTTISAEIYGGDGQDTIFGTQAADVIYANGPANTGGDGAEGDGGEGRPGSHIYGGGGDDVLFGARGRDYLDAGTGRNLIHAGRDGAEGRDTLIGASAPDVSPQSDAVPLTATATNAVVDELTTLDEVLANWNDDATSPIWPT